MDVRSWCALLIIYIGNLFLGAFLFNMTECPVELEELERQLEIDTQMSVKIQKMRKKMDPEENEALEDVIRHWVDRGFVMVNVSRLETIPEIVEPVCTLWGHQNALFFSFTVVTTIGYGHQAPTTTAGRMICIMYALIGIPLNAILIGALGNVFRNPAILLKNKLWLSLDKTGAENKPRALVVFVETLVFFTLFFVAFLPVPAIIFTALENEGGDIKEGPWSFLDSLYYTFITLSTIGFGDMVPDRQQHANKSDTVRYVYLAAIIIWIIFGMGYIFGVVDVLSGTLRAGSKPVKKAFKGLVNELHLDDYWKKILGEIIKIKQSHGEELYCGVLEGGAGGSQPCLASMEVGQDNLGMRRALSTGDLEEAVCLLKEVITATISRTASMSDQHFVPTKVHKTDLTVSEDEDVSDPDTSSDISLDHDTITSLRQFFKNAPATSSKPGWLENNLPRELQSRTFGRDDSQTQESVVRVDMQRRPSIVRVHRQSDSLETEESAVRLSRQNSLSRYSDDRGVYRQNSLGGRFVFEGEEQRPTLFRQQTTMEDDPRVPSSRRVTRTGSSVSRSSRMSTRSGGTIGQLLDDTTLGEFLSAVENVRKRTELDGSTQSLAHPPRPSQTFSKRKTSFAGYTSAAFAATKRFTTSKVTTDKNDLKKKEEVALVDPTHHTVSIS